MYEFNGEKSRLADSPGRAAMLGNRKTQRRPMFQKNGMLVGYGTFDRCNSKRHNRHTTYISTAVKSEPATAPPSSGEPSDPVNAW
jgi:hypothetical protein